MEILFDSDEEKNTVTGSNPDWSIRVLNNLRGISELYFFDSVSSWVK